MDVAEYLPMLPLWYAVFLLSATAHEAAHALAARLGGDDTAYLTGQVSLNPVPHVMREPFGTVLIPLLTFFFNSGQWMIGWASAPYDPSWEDRHPRRAALMALAGPAANLVLAAIALIIIKIGLASGYWVLNYYYVFDFLVLPAQEGSGLLEGAGRLLSIMMNLNILLFVFNLMPITPLDGGSVTAGLFEPARRFRDWMRSMPMGNFIGIVAAWILIRFLWGPVASVMIWLISL